MQFLHTWAIPLGLAAAALPVLVHWLTRPRPVRLPLSTLRFVREAVKQRRARHRLRDAIILALRTAAVLLLAAAIARPWLGDRPERVLGEAGSSARVVLLDTSQSMAAAETGIPVFERARAAAARQVQSQPGLRVNLIFAGATPRAVFAQPSANLAVLRDELARSTPAPERLDVKRALQLAAEMLAGSPIGAGGRRELIVISDFQRTNWAAADFSVLPQDTKIRLESAASSSSPANFALTRAGWQGRTSQGREAVLEAEVGNFTPTPQTIEIEVSLGSKSYRMKGHCPAGSRTTLTRAIAFEQAGWQQGELRLVGIQDALSEDNSRPLVVEVRRTPVYALITRQSDAQRSSSSYYLQRALAPTADDGRSPVSLFRVSGEQMEALALAPADLIVLDHPGKLSAQGLSLLATLLRRGRHVLYVASEPVDAANLKLLARAAGAELQLPVEFQPPPAGQIRRELFLTEMRRDRPPFGIFGDSLAALAGPLRFAGGLASRRIEGTLDDDVLAGFSDRSACLVLAPCGAGTLAVLNADLNQSNLPTSPVFVPLLSELVERMFARNQPALEVASGEPVAAYLPPDAGTAAGLQVAAPDGSARGELLDEGAAVVWRMPSAGQPGISRIERDGEVVFALASALPPEESDLRPLEPAVLKERLSGGRQIEYRAADDLQRNDWWTWLAVACVLCLVGEVAALRCFRT